MDCIEQIAERGVLLSSTAIPSAGDLSPSAAAVRAALLDGLTTVEAFAEGADKSKRTVDAWIAQGMPTVRVGRTVYIPIAEARAWLLKPSTRNASPRKPGRPRNLLTKSR